MADLPDDMMKKLQEMIEGFKGMGQYSKDLQAAVAASTRPMQQLSEYAKAIREHITQMSEQLKSSQTATETMSKQMTELANQMKQSKEDAKDHADILTEAEKKLIDQKIATEQWRTAISQAKHEEKAYWAQITKETYEHREALKETSSIWEKMKKQAEDYQAKMARAGGTAATTISETLLGGKGLAGGVGNIMSSLGSLLPMAGIGGLIGMMIAGKIRDEDFRAVGETAGQMFDQITGHSKRFSGEMGGIARQLETYGMGTKEDVVAVAQGFASTGVSADEAGRKIVGLSTRFGHDLVASTLAADKALELPAGTFAKLSGTLARDFNTSAEKAFMNLASLAQGAREAGMNAAVFMQQVMETSSALTLLNAKIDDTGAAQLKLSSTMQARGFGAQYAQQYAAAGMQSAAGAVANMGEGLAAIIGQKLGYGSGIEALYAMKSGSGATARGEQQLDLVEIMKQMREVLPGQTRAEQAFAATKLFGVSYAGADAILDAMQEANSYNADSKQVQKLLHQAFETEGEKQNRVLQEIKVMQDAVSQISVALLKIAVDILKGIYQAIMAMSANIQASLSFGEKSRLLAEEAALYKRAAGQSFGDIYANQFGIIGRAGQQFGGAVGRELSTFGLSGFNPSGVEDIDKQLAAMASNSSSVVNAVGGKHEWDRAMSGDVQKFRSMLIARAKEIEQSSGGKTGSTQALEIAGSEIQHKFGGEAAGVGKLVIQLKTEAKLVEARPPDSGKGY